MLASYSVAKRLLDIVNMVIKNFTSLISVKFLKGDNYRKNVLRYAPVLVIISLALYSILYYLGPLAISYVFVEYDDAGHLFRWTSISIIFMPYNWLLGRYIAYMNFIKENAFVILTWSLLRSILYITLYQSYGIYGIFYTEIITNAYAAILRTLIVMNYLKFIKKLHFPLINT